MKIDENALDQKMDFNLLKFKKLVFGALFLHGIVLERKK